MNDGDFNSQLSALLPKLRRFARGLAGGADGGDDLVQSACERALRNQAQWRPGTRLDSWLYRIVQTLWLDERRAAKVRGIHVELDETSDRALVHQGGPAMEARMALGEVYNAMALMPDDQRIILLLVGTEGLSYRECADVLGIPLGTVMSRLARARQALLRLVDQPVSEVAP